MLYLCMDDLLGVVEDIVGNLWLNGAMLVDYPSELEGMGIADRREITTGSIRVEQIESLQFITVQNPNTGEDVDAVHINTVSGGNYIFIGTPERITEILGI